MEISASLVKQLREMTDAGMMDCKKALVEVGGDIEAAVKYLREKGLSKAAKKADRVAAEGAIALRVSENRVIMVEVNSETDFVAKNENFQKLCSSTLDLIDKNNIENVESLNSSSINGISFDEYLKGEIAKIGENIVVRRLALLDSSSNLLVSGYLHSNSRIGTIVALSYTKESSKAKLVELANSLCMHAAAMKPQIISYDEFSDDFIAKEKAALIAEVQKENEELKRLGKTLKTIPEFISKKEITSDVLAKQEEILKNTLREQKKPENIWDRIIPGMLERFIADNTILDQRLTFLGQFFVLDDKKTIAQVLEAKSKELDDSISIAKYIRFELGEGIEKVEEDFAKEVANQMK